MQSCWRTPSEEHELRYSLEAVRKATRIAAQLERHRSETLSVSEIEALARELEIDPECMRRALEEVEPEPPVAAKRGTEAVFRPKSVQDPHAYRVGTAPTVGERLGWGLAAAAAGMLLPALWLGTAPRKVVHASMLNAPVPQATTRRATGIVPGNSVLLNGSFTCGPGQTALPLESGALRGWSVLPGKVKHLPHAPGARGGSVCLQEGGALRQLFRTQPYASYRLSLDLSGAQTSHAALHRLAVTIAGETTATAVHFTEAKGEGAPGWTRFAMEFVAREPGTTVELRVADEVEGGGGAPIVDNVAVIPVVTP